MHSEDENRNIRDVHFYGRGNLKDILNIQSRSKYFKEHFNDMEITLVQYLLTVKLLLLKRFCFISTH